MIGNRGLVAEKYEHRDRIGLVHGDDDMTITGTDLTVSHAACAVVWGTWRTPERSFQLNFQLQSAGIIIVILVIYTWK